MVKLLDALPFLLHAAQHLLRGYAEKDREERSVDFDYTPQEEAFRRELRTWLEANPPEGYEPETFEQIDQDERFAIQLKWQRKLYAAGWVGIHWPQKYGGRGATMVEQTIYQQEMARVRAPSVANSLGISIVGPTLIHWGTEEQKKRYVPKILSAEEIWRQGYSEPNSVRHSLCKGSGLKPATPSP